MILNGDKIKELIINKKLMENYNIENIRGCSYDVTSSDYILKIKTKKSPISLNDAEAITNMYEKTIIKDSYNLKPNECVLIPLKEKFNIPNFLCAHLRGRTSYNRLGIYITLQHLNPGYQGTLNLTVTNLSPNTYTITPHMRIAQIVFEELDANVKESLLYGNELTPVYQNEDGSSGSKIYNDLVGKVIRHYKGNYYYVEDIGLNSETKEYMIIYKTLYNRKDSNIWTRPANMFFEKIDPNKPDNITKQLHRFEIVDTLNIDYTKKEERN